MSRPKRTEITASLRKPPPTIGFGGMGSENLTGAETKEKSGFDQNPLTPHLIIYFRT